MATLSHSGYLTVDDKEQENMYELRIPNKEVHSFFQESFIQNSWETTIHFSIF